jgi:hypothetical protein
MTKGRSDWHGVQDVEEAWPPDGFVLAFVQFEGPVVKPAIHVAYYSARDGKWRTRYGRLWGMVTHWMPLPEPPEIEAESET